MSATESGREPGDRMPVFVDASGRRRRGVLVLGYLGASAATAYMAAFGLTVGTRTVSLAPVGATLVPTPMTDDGDAGGVVGEPVVAPVSEAVSVPARHVSPRSERSSARHARADRAEPAAAPVAERAAERAAERVAAPRARVVAVRVVRAPQRVETAVRTRPVTPESPRSSTVRPEQGTSTAHTSASGAHSSGADSSGADPSGAPSSGNHSSGTAGASGTSDPVTADVLDTVPASTSTQV